MSLAVVLMALVLFVLPFFAQSGWQTKPPADWTLADSRDLLSDSPWAQSRTMARRDINLIPGTSVDPGSVTCRLRSALPVRLAMVRLRQIAAKYDKMGPTQKADFDKSTQLLLECPACTDNYVVTLSPPFDHHSAIPSSLKTLTLATLKNYVRITNERGETRELLHIDRPNFQGAEAVFFFARLNSKGEPLLTPSSKKLTVTFDMRLFTDHTALPMVFDFEVSKIVMNGEVFF